MDKIIITIFFFCAAGSKAQTSAEWFSQKKTKIKYLTEQIAALQMYAGYAEKGYSIADKGLQTIRAIKQGDFSLHNSYFNSLSALNPSVNKYVRVADIISMQFSIAKQVRSTIKNCNQLTAKEINYLRQVFNNVLDDCAKNLDDLVGLITDGEQQMKDDERIKRIDNLYAEMQDKQIFVRSFRQAAQGLCVKRRNDQYDITIEKKLNGLQ